MRNNLLYGGFKVNPNWSEDEAREIAELSSEVSDADAENGEAQGAIFHAAMDRGLVGGEYVGQGSRGYGVGDPELEDRAQATAKKYYQKKNELEDKINAANQAAKLRDRQSRLERQGIPGASIDMASAYYKIRETKRSITYLEMEINDLEDKLNSDRTKLDSKKQELESLISQYPELNIK